MIAVTATSNRSKVDQTPSDGCPHAPYCCQYVTG